VIRGAGLPLQSEACPDTGLAVGSLFTYLKLSYEGFDLTGVRRFGLLLGFKLW